MAISPTDLTQRPPRSARTRLGGYIILPRMIDKCRALVSGNIGEYHYDCPLDKRFIQFVGLDAKRFAEEVKAGKGDGELLLWIEENASIKRSPQEIAAWAEFELTRTPGDLAGRERFAKWQASIGANRTDVVTLYDLLDLDDFVSFGGKA
ncbi:MAG: DUF5069 domain-containing protein [Puniceicoccales bacterium]|nr:DUF5069 domain-containing protein [Puniceicoccales bacterium]